MTLQAKGARYALNLLHFEAQLPEFLSHHGIQRMGCGDFLCGEIEEFSGDSFDVVRNSKVIEGLGR